MSLLFIHLYSTLLDTLFRGVGPFISQTAWAKRFHLMQRCTLPSAIRQPAETRIVWVHGASLGECKLLLKVIGILRQVHPTDRYIATAVTDSGLEYLQKHKPSDVVGCGYLPYDSLGIMKQMLQKLSIARVWLLETELWPGLLAACADLKVPVGIINGRMEQNSLKGYRQFGFLLRPLFAQLAPVLVQSAEYAQRFAAVGVPKEVLRVTGNLKSNVAIRAANAPWRLALRKQLGIDEQEWVVTAGCIHPGEADIVRKAQALVLAQGKRFRLLTVPRHREAVAALHQELGSQTTVLTTMETQQSWDSCIIDRYGVLDDCYALADVAIIGGTFVPVGGHNPWDAACWAIPVLFGPHYFTQEESCQRLLQAGVAHCVANADALAQALMQVHGAQGSTVSQAIARLAAQMSLESDSVQSVLRASA